MAAELALASTGQSCASPPVNRMGEEPPFSICKCVDLRVAEIVQPFDQDRKRYRCPRRLALAALRGGSLTPGRGRGVEQGQGRYSELSEGIVTLIVYYVVFMVIGSFAAYFLGCSPNTNGAHK